jgi:hypothetical protein
MILQTSGFTTVSIGAAIIGNDNVLPKEEVVRSISLRDFPECSAGSSRISLKVNDSLIIFIYDPLQKGSV